MKTPEKREIQEQDPLKKPVLTLGEWIKADIRMQIFLTLLAAGTAALYGYGYSASAKSKVPDSTENQ